jgi:putative endonuclease
MGRVAKAPKIPAARPWFVYMLLCSNNCLYTGIATDVEKRLKVHNSGKGSAYVRAHRPARLLAFVASENRSAASILERQIKALSRARKLALAKTWRLRKAEVRRKKDEISDQPQYRAREGSGSPGRSG